MMSPHRSRLIVQDYFPSMDWLRANLASRADWPTVLIHSRVRDEYRPDIVGPLCLFTNPTGRAEIIVDQRRLQLRGDGLIVSAPGDRFTLEYEHSVEALNFYFADDWVADVAQTLARAEAPRDEIDPSDDLTLRILPRLALAEDHVGAYVDRVRSTLSEGDALAREEAVLELLGQILIRNKAEWQDTQRLTAKRLSTRLELRRRVQRAVDHMIAYSEMNVSLDELARTASLSKFHLLRSFKQLMGRAPSAYLTHLRVRRAAHQLSTTESTLDQIAEAVGFGSARALSRAFKREMDVSPGRYAKI